MVRKKMGEILIDMWVITQESLEEALQIQKSTGKRLGKILEDMDVVLEEDVAKALAKQFEIPHVKGLSRYRFPNEVLKLVDADLALSRFIFPLKLEGKVLHLAMSDPLDVDLQKDLSFKINMRISPCVTTTEEIKSAIQKHYLKKIEVSEEDRKWNILLVDYQEMSVAAAAAALQREGFTIYKAPNGAEGLKMATRLRPQLIVTDIAMPRMDGIEMFRSIKENRDLANTPVIAMSSKATAEEEFRLLEMGFFDFIPKPVNPLRLVARVRRAMRQTQGRFH